MLSLFHQQTSVYDFATTLITYRIKAPADAEQAAAAAAQQQQEHPQRGQQRERRKQQLCSLLLLLLRGLLAARPGAAVLARRLHTHEQVDGKSMLQYNLVKGEQRT